MSRLRVRHVMSTVLLIVLAVGLLAPSPATARRRREDPAFTAAAARWLAPLRRRLEGIRKRGGLRYTPTTFLAADTALVRLEESLRARPDTAVAPQPEYDLARLAVGKADARIATVQRWRGHKYGWEAAAEDYDALVADVASVVRVSLPETLLGPAAGRAAVDSLYSRLLQLRTTADSLAGANRHLAILAGAEQSARDSLVEALRGEVSLLRKRVWDLELRAEAVEADRGAVAAEVRRQREREAFLRSVQERFAGGRGEVLLTPDGTIRLRLTGLHFASGSAWLNPRYDPLLDDVADVLRRMPGATVRVEGHTDDSGSREVNLRLSRQRAAKVAAALAKRLQRPVDEFTVVGLGPDHPIAANDTPAGRARNRRIEVVVTPPSPAGGTGVGPDGDR